MDVHHLLGLGPQDRQDLWVEELHLPFAQLLTLKLSWVMGKDSSLSSAQLTKLTTQ